MVVIVLPSFTKGKIIKHGKLSYNSQQIYKYIIIHANEMHETSESALS